MMKEKASILIEALPYIKKFYGKTFVVKYGGSVFNDESVKEGFFEDIAMLKLVGINIVIVHGGGVEIKSFLEKLNIESKFHEGLRVTNSDAMEIVEMVLSGNINRKIVSQLCCHGLKGIGLSGRDNKLILCEKKELKDSSVDLGHVGEIIEVNEKFISDLLINEYIPVIAPIGCDKLGEPYNINADSVAGAISSYIGAEKLILITDVPGIMKDVKDQSSLISKINVNELEKLRNSKTIKGGMIPKIDCSIDSIKSGTKNVHIIGGGKKHSILEEIFTNDGIGTMIGG